MDAKNRTLTTLLRRIVIKSLRGWDIKHAYAKFAYNRAPSYATSHSPFEVCSDLNPCIPINLIPISQESNISFEAEARANKMKKQHEQVRSQVEKVNEQYKLKANKNRTHLEFKLGDRVWLCLRK